VTSVNSIPAHKGRVCPASIITGSSFQSGATCSFGAGINGELLHVQLCHSTHRQHHHQLTATVGARNLAVTNPDNQTGTLTNGFSVTTVLRRPR